MNNNIEVIGIDHGWSQMKTSNTCFNTSIKELANAPAFHDNVLEYDDRYFAVGEERLEVLDSKVENENFYLLTLVAIAKELEIRGKSEADVVLAVGLPLTRFSAERKPFIDYLFNHQTNVDVDNRFVVYGIRDLGTELSPITMLVMMESIQQRIVENGKRGKATWLYIDEFHVLLNSEYSAKYLQQLWKKVRKQGGLCTGITQNVIDLLQNYTATTMLANSEFVALLKQANTDSSKMAEVIGVSDAQLRFVTNSQSGMGLLKCGNVVIPFDNQIGKDTSLYKLYNTNIHEIIENSRLSHLSKP